MILLTILDQMFKELQEKRERNGGLVQGCQHISEDLKEKLESAGLPVQRCLLKSPYGPFENTQTDDYIDFHYFLLSGDQVFDPFVSNKPINLKDYFSFYRGDQLHIGIPNQEGTYHFIPIGIF